MKFNKSIMLGLCASVLLSFEATHASELTEAHRKQPVKQVLLPKINLEDFDLAVMKDVLMNCGTFELVGPSADSLRELRQRAMAKQKIVLNLPIEILEQVTHKKGSLETIFNGFQNLEAESIASYDKAIAEGREPLDRLTQIALHRKPHQEKFSPGGIDISEYDDYYYASLAVLKRLYFTIAEHFIPKENWSDLENDKQSALSSRKYYEKAGDGVLKGWTGIRAHSDHGLLTMVVSDKPGLEALYNQDWISAPSGLEHVIINVGDWLSKDTNIPFKAGVHRVLPIKGERYSLATFLNPKFTEKRMTPSGMMATFEEYLKDRNKYLAVSTK
ncbi:MAG: isopenicillin N synthase family oxygenase [Alphaproteobacteria bacterium]|nr:isopenicillin N synthase family oxygenase [Alphaproteobacteria bacterium]